MAVCALAQAGRNSNRKSALGTARPYAQERGRMYAQLNSNQLESLQQAANEEKMRPGQQDFPVEDWREVPTSQEEFEKLSPDDQTYWLEVSNTF